MTVFARQAPDDPDVVELITIYGPITITVRENRAGAAVLWGHLGQLLEESTGKPIATDFSNLYSGRSLIPPLTCCPPAQVSGFFHAFTVYSKGASTVDSMGRSPNHGRRK